MLPVAQTEKYSPLINVNHYLTDCFSPRNNESARPELKTYFCEVEKSKQRYKQQLAADTINSLRSVSDNPIIQTLADRIEFCNSDKNLFVAADLHNADGEAFDGKGSFWSCNSRLCPNCVGKLSRRNRKIIRYVIENEKLRIGEDWFFITYTMPDLALKGLSLVQIAQMAQTAWAKFTHCETNPEKSQTWFQKHIRGGFKNGEFTIGKHNQIHFHYHSLSVCKTRIRANDFTEIRREWTKALKFAFKKHNLQFVCNTSDGLANVNVQKLRDKEKAILELCKYVTKNDSWSKIQSEQLAEIALIPRFGRMFETFGVCRKTAREMGEKPITEPLNANNESVKDTESGNNNTYLDTKNLIPSEQIKNSVVKFDFPKKKRKPWRVRCREVPLWQYRIELLTEIEEVRAFRQIQLRRKFACATFQVLNGDIF